MEQYQLRLFTAQTLRCLLERFPVQKNVNGLTTALLTHNASQIIAVSFKQLAFMQTVACDNNRFLTLMNVLKLVIELGKQIQKTQKKRWAVDTARVMISQTSYSTHVHLVVQ